MSERSGILRRLLRCFGCSLRGLAEMLRTESNARIHAAITPLVLAAGWFFGITFHEWIAIVAAIGMVWTAEALNTAIEITVDLASPHEHPLAGRAKDIAAGGVLCAAVAAAIIGLVVFIPRVSAWFA